MTDIYPTLHTYLPPKTPLQQSPPFERYKSYIAYGNQIRQDIGPDHILADSTIMRIVRKRIKLSPEPQTLFDGRVYLLHQFKRKEEIDLLRSVYGRLFFQVSIYSRRGARVDYLARLFAGGQHSAMAQPFRAKAEELIQDDENQAEERHGQRVAKIFHDADFIVNVDVATSVKVQVRRFCELLFSSNSISPNKIEYGMYMAKAAALRTLDLSRQVGAAIFTRNGEVVSMGSNEVPTADGGTYWCDEEYDDRDYKREYDSNDRRKVEILTEILIALGREHEVTDILNDPKIRDSQFMDVLEYGRIVHAEMSAICDAARLGRPVAGGTLFCTTFPCHMCAKHIVAAGISRVIFLEPYPKSLAQSLHSDSLQIEGGDRGQYQQYPAVQFEHFYGVTPRRYREIFERAHRKNKEDGSFVPYNDGNAIPFVDIKFPFYQKLEDDVMAFVLEKVRGIDSDEFFETD